MTELVISCPKCGYGLHLPDRSFLGRKGRCPECQLKFILDEEKLVNDLVEQAQQVVEEAEPIEKELSPAAPTASENAGKSVESNKVSAEKLDADDVKPEADVTSSEKADAQETMALDESTDVGHTSPVESDEISEVFGRYRILRELGQGSMGSVYLAHDTQLDRKVALKIPKLRESRDATRTQRFFREARAAATLRHPNICPVYDIGEIDGKRYIAMAYIKGRPLSAFIKRQKPQPVRRIASTLRKLARALQEAHNQGIIHRDLKPDNILIDDNRQPIIMDFGLARQLGNEDDARLTTSGAIVGSPAYMSPEQVNPELGEVGPASDIFSLGVVVYEFLTQQRPFKGTFGTIFGKISSHDPEKPSKLRPEIDPEMDEICLKMLAKKIEDRYESMGELAEVVREYLKKTTPKSPGYDSAFSISVFEHTDVAPADVPSVKKTKVPAPEKKRKKVVHRPAGKSETKVLAAQKPDSKGVAVSAATDPDRFAAEWVLEIGGTIKISVAGGQTVSVTDPKTLPQEPFRVVDVSLLRNKQVDDESLKHFSGLAELVVLRLSDTGVTDTGLVHLAGLTGLPVLDLSYTNVTDAGLRHLSGLTGLKELDLANTKVTDAGLESIRNLTQLQFLGLYATTVTDAGIRKLWELKELQFLGLFATQVTDKGIAKLKKSLRNCTVSR